MRHSGFRIALRIRIGRDGLLQHCGVHVPGQLDTRRESCGHVVYRPEIDSKLVFVVSRQHSVRSTVCPDVSMGTHDVVCALFLHGVLGLFPVASLHVEAGNSDNG